MGSSLGARAFSSKCLEAAYLDALTRNNGLVWFGYGGNIKVFKTTESETRMLPLSQATPERFSNVLNRHFPDEI